MLDAVIGVYGTEVARNLLEIKAVNDTWHDNTVSPPVVSGMIGSPALNRGNRDYLSFFVNRRPIKSRLLSWAVEEAYRGLLMQGRHPVAIINITIPPAEVDVNIHPTKAEVKSRDEQAVFRAVQRAVRGTLVELAPVPRIDEPAATYRAPPAASTGKLWAALDRDAVPTDEPTAIETTPPGSLPALRVLGQVNSTYIVTEGPDGLYLIDQHAAHERVLYEQFREQQSKHKVEVQGLLEPVPFEVTAQQDEVLRIGYQQLTDSGFSIEPFGNRTYLVRAIPALLDRKDWTGMVRELLDNAAEGKVTDWADGIAITLACHSAIRAGKVLNHEEMRGLIQQLERSEMPRTCPHGRPTVLHMSSHQLEKEFRRS